ncbi:unnamed protein product [Anisakis simplex]|uniref:Uncharacterized protein n=1 Tax=Anisakis simplex TaxID=6269 RepID=A0A3P6P7K4_ANISI|nr:unnamed protein product [Anisakis simplex]
MQFRGTKWTYTQRFVALIRAAEGGDMLRPELFDRALEVHKYLSESFSVVVDGRAYHHSDLCKQYCDVNKALYVLKVNIIAFFSLSSYYRRKRD